MMMHSSACDCEASLCETLRGFSAQHPDSVIHQTSLMSALLSGVYEGETTIADLLAHGDFGTGTFNELDGEMIAFSSRIPAACRRQRPGREAGAENAVRGDDRFNRSTVKPLIRRSAVSRSTM